MWSQRAMMLTLGALAVVAALVYGIFAGRHDAPPAPTVIAIKSSLERALGLKRQWRRGFHEDTTGLVPVDCPADPLVVLTGGQSNAANGLSDPVDPDPSVPAFMLYEGQCFLLQDPLLGATGKRGSIWTALGHALARRLDQPVVFINTAVTATTYESWLDDRSGYFLRLEHAVEQALEMGLQPDLILWHQGESNAHRKVDQATFERSLGALLDRLLSVEGLGEAQIMLYRASVCTGARRDGNAPLIAAQTALASRRGNVHVGPNTDTLGLRDRFDGCHFNARGRDRIVAMSLDLIVRVLEDHGGQPD